MSEEIIDTEILALENEQSLEFAFAWWEKKRLVFNLIVGVIGTIVLLLFLPSYNIFDFIGIIIYGVCANAAFCTGFLLEAFDSHYFNKVLNVYKNRKVLYGLGLLFSVIFTSLLAYIYCSHTPF